MSIRKMFFLLFSVVILFVFCSCEKKSIDSYPGYRFGTDCQYYNCTDGWYRITESEKGFYFCKEGYLYFIDKTTMQQTILCGKPNCQHQDETTLTNCNSYIGSRDFSLHYYDGNIYTMCIGAVRGDTPSPQIALVQISPDGSERKEIWEVDWEEDFPGYPVFSTLHRGKYFLVLHTNGDTAGAVLRYDFDTKKVKMIHRFDGYLGQITAIGNTVYWQQDDNNGNRGTVAYDILSEEKTVLEDCKRVYVTEDTLLFYHFISTMEEYKEWIVTTDLDRTNEEIYPFDIGLETRKTKRIFPYGDDLFVFDGYDGREIRQYDFATGELLATLPLPEDFLAKEAEIPAAMRRVACSQNGKLMVFYEKTFDAVYCDISTIGTPNFQWHEVEKFN